VSAGRALDLANARFWDELCGSRLAMELGVRDHSLESLKRFDRGYLDFYPYLLKHVPVGSMRDRTVLEIGLGYGTLGQCIAESGADYIGMDLAETPVRMMAHRLALQGLPGRVVRASVLACPFDDCSVDAVVSIGCFHHTGDIERCIRETFRVLRPGGRAHVMVYNKYSLRQWTRWPFVTLWDLARETFSMEALPSSESQRRAYDARMSGAAAPETTFMSRGRLRGLFGRFSQLRIRAENSDPVQLGGRTLVSREHLLSLGWLWGLDLYVEATK
jgi:SAM-dependent methyltransferase